MATVNLGSIKFKWKGTYAGGTAYTIDDVVSYNGSSYICIQASTGNLPTDTAYFEQMSQKGTDGTNGTDGTDVGTVITTQGDILYRDGSGLQRLGAGTSGQVLQTGGTGANPSWGTVSSDYVKLATVNASSSSSVALDGYFTSDYQRYEIHASDVIPGSSCDFWYRVYTGGSEVTGNIYNNTSAYWYTDTTPTVSGGGGNNADSQDMDAPSNYWKMGGDDHYSGQPCIFKIVIHDPLNTTKRKIVELMTAYSGNGGSGGVLMHKHGHGVAKTTDALTGFAFYPTAGSITSGTFKLYGIK